MDTKIWFLLAFVAVVQSNDLSEGSDGFGTNIKKIFDGNKKANPAIWRQVDNITINGDESAKITKIVVTDLREEKDGEAKIVEGGIGQQNVTIELKSPAALRGYDFHIEVYANSDKDQASTSHDSKPETIPAKSIEQTKPVNTNPSVPITLIREDASSTSEPHEDLIKGGKRQNREAEDKDKSHEEINPYSFRDVTTEVPELKSTDIPTNKDKREDKLEHGISNHPVHLQEAPKMPESTVRIPTTEVKKAEQNQNHQETHDDVEAKKHTTVALNEKVTNTYSQFNVREVTPNVPVNLQSPVESHKRHARDVAQNSPVVEITEHSLPTTVKNQGPITTKVPSDQTHQPENTALPTENIKGKDQVTIDKVEEKTVHVHHHNNRFNGRYIPDRFARNRHSSSSETSTEINKVSTVASTSHDNTAQSTSNIPRTVVNGQTTNKPETATDKQVNSDITELHINTKKGSEEATAHKRITRDTTDKVKEPSVLPTGNLKDSSSTTTLKPELNSFKAPVEASENNKEIKKETPKADNLDNKDKQRNVRGAEENKEKVNVLSTSTTKPETHEDNVSTDKTPVQVPIQLKSSLKEEPKDAKEIERIARDVISTPKLNFDKKLPSPTEVTNGDIEKTTKSDEKLTIEHDKAEQKETSTGVPNVESSTKSEIHPKIGENPTQLSSLKNEPGKFTREIKKDETTTIVEQNTKNELSTSKPSVDAKKGAKEPEKSLLPPQ